jgi:hypothetical protein
MLGGAVIFAITVLGARIERFLSDVLDTIMHAFAIDNGAELVHYDLQGSRCLGAFAGYVVQNIRGWQRTVSEGRKHSMMSYTRDKRTFTLLVEEAARLWCRSGLWYAGVDLCVKETSATTSRVTATPRRPKWYAHILDGDWSSVFSKGWDVELGFGRVYPGYIGFRGVFGGEGGRMRRHSR